MKEKIITENEVPEILKEELPNMKSELQKFANAKNVYKTIECFVIYTKQLINTGKLKAVKHCFSVAEKMLENGNAVVKNAIENVFVYSLSTVLDLSDSTSNEVKKIFNGSLKKEYNRQLLARGI